MSEILASIGLALRLIGGGDPGLWAIVALSLEVSLAAAVLACVVGLPLGGLIAVRPFPGRRAVIVSLNALLGLPSVVVGLVVYLLLSRAGPMGSLGILFTPTAIIVAQTLLVLPIVAAMARQFVEDGWHEYEEQLTSLGVTPARAVLTLLWDLRYSLLTVVLLGFGRAASEVGAVMIVGGNIDGVTRVMTTAIALETSKGDLPLALALGIVLIAVVLTLNAGVYAVREWSTRRHG
ncbi:ABC transporter permease [Usitatibacter palustris]|uniref:Tungstate uptake system permease protein TupB n=1 Tax=Usitatibacter palustris TaxID=2732487 RepID=A0A6M4H236_9PROT|nr:ABC transporter permease [Usitatibacter palustris]QJR13599.1 Tungstate uptake system permease protein TupB [Usitatibacter palustris]